MDYLVPLFDWPLGTGNVAADLHACFAGVRPIYRNHSVIRHECKSEELGNTVTQTSDTSCP